MADLNLNADANLNGEGFSAEEIEAARVTALALGQLSGDELAAVEAKLAALGGDVQRRKVADVLAIRRALMSMRESEPSAGPSEELRALVRSRFEESKQSVVAVQFEPKQHSKAMRRIVTAVVGVAACLLIGLLVLPAVRSYRIAAMQMNANNQLKQIGMSMQNYHSVLLTDESRSVSRSEAELQQQEALIAGELASQQSASDYRLLMSRNDRMPPSNLEPTEVEKSLKRGGQMARAVGEIEFVAPAVPNSRGVEDPIKRMERMKAQVRKDKFNLVESLDQVERARNEKQIAGFPIRVGKEWEYRGYIEPVGTEQYAPIHENRFLSAREAPLSTFSIDVDTASYSNVRRFLGSGRLPPADSVRIEELVNYFRYEYSQPREGEPFAVNMEVAECPWSGIRGQESGVREETGGQRHWLLRVGIQGREVARSERPASNLVFLLDVSGSMADENKLPLLKMAMKMLVGELGQDDRVSIVTYAGEAGLKLLPTRGNEQRKIARVIDGLSAGGSTNGSAGIELAYEQAAAGFVEGGTNRVILCTDGDLNVGITSDEALVKLIKQKAKGGVFLTVLGFGTGNLKDGKMERLADNGNGLYAYIDSVREARKVLVEQLTGSTIAIAKDVKIQIEFNPAQITAYRLLGYENRVLAAKDFNNDKKDAGEIGAGHAVTAIYEIVPVGAGDDVPVDGGVGPLKYQGVGEGGSGRGGEVGGQRSEVGAAEELLTLKLRYKEPEGEVSKLLEFPLKERAVSFRSASEDFQFAASVASFGMVLRGSQYRGDSNLAFVEEIAASSLGRDEGGYRAEFLDFVRKARGLGVR